MKSSQYISAGRKPAWRISNLSSDLESKKPSHPYFKMRINICLKLQYYFTLSNSLKIHIVLLSDTETRHVAAAVLQSVGLRNLTLIVMIALLRVKPGQELVMTMKDIVSLFCVVLEDIVLHFLIKSFVFF